MEWLSYPFVQRALVGGVLIGLMTAWVGTFVVLRRMAFMGAGVGHAAFGGVALGLLLGWDPVLTAAGFCILVAWGITAVVRRGTLTSDTAIGIFFAATMALGILLLGLVTTSTDVFGYLFGSVLAMGTTDVRWLFFAALVEGALLVGLHKEFVALAFDPEFTRVSGLPEALLDYLFATLVAVTVVLAIKMVGLILASALLVIPGATALHLSRDFRTLMALALTVGVASVVVGLGLSLWWNTPPGATMVLAATFFFALSWVFRRG